mgnify:CR=1 FL=1
MTKTNVMRLLDAAGIEYIPGEYEVDENNLSGSHAADMMGVEHDSMYKTLVLKGEKKGYLVCCIPVDEELDLKKVAKDLNSSAAGRTLIIDLDEKPRSPEAFFDLLETYCRKSSVTLEYVKKDIPATVKLEGRLHTVALTESYMYGGPVWSMEIREIL